MSHNAIWGYLHDGSIDRVDGTVPGDIAVHISIPYLRKAFIPAGDGFVLTLGNCTQFELESDSGVLTNDLRQIAEDSPEILSILTDSPLTIYTTFGTLKLNYHALSLALDSGQPLTAESLDQASEQYWQAWSEQHRGSA